MFQKDKWPFVSVCLSEIMDRDTLAVIESGCCERLGRPLTILEYDPDTEGFSHRIESINEKQRYEGFCRFLRDEEHVKGGDRACKEWDIAQTRISLEEFYRTEDPFRTFQCHMRLQDMTYIIRIRNRPVALVFSGQYCPAGGTGDTQKIVQRLGTGSYSHIKLGDSERKQLLSLAQEVPPMPVDVRDRLEREAKHIQRIAEAAFERGKRQWEQDFLDELRRTSIGLGEVVDRNQLQQKLCHLLELTRAFCRCEYVVFFGSVQEGDTVLAPIAEAGVPPAMARSPPHFNWKKAGLPLRNFDSKAWDIAQWYHEAGTGGIRGDNSEYFTGAGCIIPTSLGDRYRGVLVLGPFAEQVDLPEERRFLIELANTIGAFALTELEVLNLERERRRWRGTATLLTHQLRTALTPITTQIGRAKFLAHQRTSKDTTTMRVVDLLETAEDLGLQLAKGARKAVAGHVLQLEREDLEFERYPLSVLVTNCTDGFITEAKQRHRQLVIDDSVEYLPEAEIDVARLTIALSNLIENAIKYSYPNSTIYIRSNLVSISDPDLASVVIEIDDIGDEIREEEFERIFEQGTRGLTAAKMGRIPGSGLGLWETRAVVEAHGGKIDLVCKPTSIRRRQGIAHHVVFSMKIPLRQKKR